MFFRMIGLSHPDKHFSKGPGPDKHVSKGTGA